MDMIPVAGHVSFLRAEDGSVDSVNIRAGGKDVLSLVRADGTTAEVPLHSQPPEPPRRPELGLTIRQAWQRWVADLNVTRCSRTLTEHRTAIKRWEQFCHEAGESQISGPLPGHWEARDSSAAGQPSGEAPESETSLAGQAAAGGSGASPDVLQNATEKHRAHQTACLVGTVEAPGSAQSAAQASAICDTLECAAELDVAQKFIVWCLVSHLKLSRSRVRAYWSTIGLVLREAERRDVIRRVPKIELPKETAGRPLVVSRSDASAMMAAADAAQWPHLTGKLKRTEQGRFEFVRQGHVTPGYVWRTWLLLYWIYGARSSDFVGHKLAADQGLLWSSVSFDPQCPDARIRTTNEAGWLDLRIKKTGVELVLPLHPAVAARLRRFVGLDSHRVFPNGRTHGNLAKNVRGFNAELAAIRAAAGVPANITISGKSAPSFRRSAINNWDHLEAGLGSVVAGHSPRSVTQRHYLEKTPRIVELLKRYPLPELPDD